MNDLTRLATKHHLIYDFDGTIAGIKIDWRSWHVGVAAIINSFDSNFRYESGRVDMFLNGYTEKYGKAFSDKVSQFNNQYELENYTGMTPNQPLIDHIKVTKQQNQKQQYILTSQNRPLLTTLLRQLELDDCFTRIVTRDDVSFIKPNPEGIKLILADNDPVSYIMVGDAKSDEGAAQAVGMDFELVKIEEFVYKYE